MAEIVRTSDFYDLEKVKERISTSLTTGEWPNIQQTDLGQALISFGANVVNQEATAFFTAMEQMYLSTCTEQGYLEAIAKNYGIVPQTVTASNIAITMRFSADRSFDPHDLCINFGEFRFYNIETVSFSAATEKTVTLYEGTMTRMSSHIHSPPNKLWTYSQMPAPLTRTLGLQNLQRYLVLPSDTYVPSITVTVASSTTSQVLYWQKVDSWFGYGEYDRIFVMEKDFVGRYWVVFGDGEFGTSYPLEQVVGIRYLVSSGADVAISDFSSYIILDQDSSDITAEVTIPEGGISSLSMGTSSVDSVSLKEEIYNKQSSYQRLVRIEDYRRYLNSRSDVLDAVVLSERDMQPPNMEMFNVLKYAVKPYSPTSPVNTANIQDYVSKYGLQTVEFRYTPVEFLRFNIWVTLAALPGYNSSSLSATVNSVLTDNYSWENLGFGETLNPQKVLADLMGVAGIDFSRFSALVEAVHTNAGDGQYEFDFGIGDTVVLPYSPRRYGVALTSEEFSGKPNHRCIDDGNGALLGDFAGEESFNPMTYNGSTAMTSTGTMFLCQGSSSVRVINTLLAEGGVSTISTAANNADMLSYDVDNDVLYTCEVVNISSRVDFRSFNLSRSQVTQDHPSYLQKQESLTIPLSDFTGLHPDEYTNASSIGGFKYFNGHVYFVINYNTGASRVYRHTASADGTLGGTYDPVYGYAELRDRNYTDIEIVKSQYGDSGNTLWAVHSTGVDLIDAFDSSPETARIVINGATGLNSITSDHNKDVYYGDLAGTVTKLHNIIKGGTPLSFNLIEGGTEVNRSMEYYLDTSNSMSLGRVFVAEGDAGVIIQLSSEIEGGTPTHRAGIAEEFSEGDSIFRAATIDYLNSSIEFDRAVTGCTLSYEVDGEFELSGVGLAVLNLINVTE